ncbi:hypothetical protein EDB89DRAFT_1952670 [Lactarius sanguifluus]|nr:hypothetical protein EDB89DRAFT_1952670 [Lactarius sanguifluus]
MLSRFSVLFVYLVAGLAVSAVATPVGQSGGYGDGTKQPPSKYNSDQEHPNPPKYYSARDTRGQYKHQRTPFRLVIMRPAGSSIYALFGGVLSQFEGTVNIGHECSASKACTGQSTGQTVCCENTDASGLFAIGCTNAEF